MSVPYVSVGWNRQKRLYDLWLAGGMVAYLAVFLTLSTLQFPGTEALSPAILLIRAFGSLGFVLLTVILSIGPLARLSPRFLPLLYNRRHAGVALFAVVLAHAAVAIVWYHSFGPVNPILSIFVSSDAYDSLAWFPFQPLGFGALIILFLMAATSHDFWNANLGPGWWKALHMLVYLAFGLVVGHVAFGALMSDYSGWSAWTVGAAALWISALHLAAGFQPGPPARPMTDGWIAVGAFDAIAPGRARIVPVPGRDPVAVFRTEDGQAFAAVTNVCRHQAGPLGEGRMVDGCIVCPWHGFQYRPEDGRSPPPYREKIATYRLARDGDQLLLDPTPLPPGTARPLLAIEGAGS